MDRDRHQFRLTRGGRRATSRLFPPRSLTLKGVILGGWMQQPAGQRNADIVLAQQLAREAGTLFEVAERYLRSPRDRARRRACQSSRPSRRRSLRFLERLGGRIMKFGTIGAGTVALAFAREALATGHEVVLSSRRGPESLADKVAELGHGALRQRSGRRQASSHPAVLRDGRIQRHYESLDGASGLRPCRLGSQLDRARSSTSHPRRSSRPTGETGLCCGHGRTPRWPMLVRSARIP